MAPKTPLLTPSQITEEDLVMSEETTFAGRSLLQMLAVVMDKGDKFKTSPQTFEWIYQNDWKYLEFIQAREHKLKDDTAKALSEWSRKYRIYKAMTDRSRFGPQKKKDVDQMMKDVAKMLNAVQLSDPEDKDEYK